MADIFNKEALEALNDHSEAEEMARVASPKLRLVLGVMLAMVAVGVYWCAFGTINDKVTAQGIVFPFGIYGYRNINLLSIDYIFRSRLRSRLTLGGRPFPRKP